MHPLLEKVHAHTAKARQINDQYPDGTPMPAEAARQMEYHLKCASDLRREVDLQAQEAYMREPQYKHDMGSAGAGAGYATKDGGYVGGGGVAHPGEHDDAPMSRASKSFWEYIRKGDRASIEAKANLVEDATGDLLVPEDYAGTIVKAISRLGTIRQRAFVRQTRSDRVRVGNIAVGTPQWGRLEVLGSTVDALGAAGSDLLYVHEATALAKIGQDELKDSPDLESVVRQAVALKFAEFEDDAYAVGTGGTQTGNSRPSGFAYRATTAGGPTITQGLTAATNATVTADNLRALPFQVPATFRQNGSYYASEDAASAIAMLKDGQGNYLQTDPTSLLGYPFIVVGGMYAMSTTGTAVDPSVMFGDMGNGYLIVDNGTMTVQVLRERFADEGKVGLLFKRRTGGDVIRPTAFARLQL